MSSPAEQAQARVESQLDALLEHEGGTREGHDPEELHQFRVAIRRLRSLLKGTPALDPGKVLQDELKWLGKLTGPVRDLDVLLERLHNDAADFEPEDQRAADKLASALRKERGQHRRRLNRALSSRRHSRLIDRLRALATTPLEDLPEPEPPQGGKPASLHKPYHRLAKAVGELDDDPPDDELHELRIYGKRLRYAAETAQPFAGNGAGKQLSALVKACKALQDVLGEHQDAVVAAERVRELGAGHSDAAVAFVAGRLVERERAKRAAARAEWPDAWQRVAVTAAALT